MLAVGKTANGVDFLHLLHLRITFLEIPADGRLAIDDVLYKSVGVLLVTTIVLLLEGSIHILQPIVDVGTGGCRDDSAPVARIRQIELNVAELLDDLVLLRGLVCSHFVSSIIAAFCSVSCLRSLLTQFV